MMTVYPGAGVFADIIKICGVIMFLAGSVCAQSPPPVPVNPPIPEPQTLQKTPLDAIVVFNSTGKQSGVLLPGNWSLNLLDDFRNFLLRDQQPPLPPFVIQDVAAAGKLTENNIELNVKITLTVTVNRSVRIPIALKEAVIADGGEISVSKKDWSALLTVDVKDNNYVLLLTHSTATETQDNVQLTVNLPILLPVRDNRFTVSYPPAASSSMTLTIPKIGIEAGVSDGAVMNSQSTETATELKITGLRANTEIRWRKIENATLGTPSVNLSVEKAVLDYKLDAGTTVCEATLPVSGSVYPPVLPEKIQIRLPKESVLDKPATEKLSAGNYTVGDPDKDGIVEVRLLKNTTGTAVIKLKTQQTFVSGQNEFRRELSGFEVIGAVRQFGALAVTVPAEMRAGWEPSGNVRRTTASGERTPGSISSTADTLTQPVNGTPQNTALFEFAAQPFLLKVRAALPQTRINVKPEYQFQVSRGLLRLTARLSYTVSGSKADKLQIQLSDGNWNFEAGPLGFVDTVGVEQNKEGLVTIPLRNPADGNFDIELQAYRVLDSDTKDSDKHRLIFSLPKAMVTWNEPATVVVVAANDVEIQPLDDSVENAVQRITGLTRQNRRSSTTHIDFAGGLQQEPLFYRSEPTGGTFVADLIHHRQKVSATMQTDIHPCDEQAFVKETIGYDVSYSPIDKLYFIVPKDIEQNGNLQIRCGSKMLELRDVFSEQNSPLPENTAMKVLFLPEAMFKFQLDIQYAIQRVLVGEGVTEMSTQTFVQPSGIPVTEHRVDVFVPPGYRSELPDVKNNDWKVIKERRLTAPDVSASFRSSEAPLKIQLQISATEHENDKMTVVERAWLQTWLTGTIRQDRGTYLVTTGKESLLIRLPAEAGKERRVFVRINNESVNAGVTNIGLLTIPIKPEQRNKQIRLELDYRYDSEILGGKAVLALPTFESGAVVQYAFWQVIVPKQKHILGYPAGWIPEYRWVWKELFFQRVPSLRKLDVGMENDPTDISAIIERSNQYLFSSLHPSETVTVYIVPHNVLVLSASAVSLVVGLVLIYFPQSRYAGSLLGLAVLLFAVLFYRPAPTLLLLQMSVFGVCLALLAAYIRRIFYRNDTWEIPPVQNWSETSEPILTPIPSQSLTDVRDVITPNTDTPVHLNRNEKS